MRLVVAAVLVVALCRPAGAEGPKPVRVGAVAYSPAAVTIFEGVKRYFEKHGMPVDYVLYSNYDALVEALAKGEVEIAWNTPLAHAKFDLRCGGKSQTLVMRDVDQNFRSVLVVNAGAGITKPSDLKGKRLAIGSRQAAELTVLPLHFLAKEGVDPASVTVIDLEKERDPDGCPCGTERHVVEALVSGRADAGIVSERLWATAGMKGFGAVWTSPAYSHCVFTAGPAFDAKLGARFTELMLAMDPADPATAELMKLEGTRKWVKGGREGFEALAEALKGQKGRD